MISLIPTHEKKPFSVQDSSTNYVCSFLEMFFKSYRSIGR